MELPTKQDAPSSGAVLETGRVAAQLLGVQMRNLLWLEETETEDSVLVLSVRRRDARDPAKLLVEPEASTLRVATRTRRWRVAPVGATETTLDSEVVVLRGWTRWARRTETTVGAAA